MPVAVKVENISKKYIINHESSEKYKTFREFITRAFNNIFYKKSKTVSRGFEEFWALKEIELEINQGERIGVIGRNGAGKSTLLKILSRITEPTTGKISLKGRIASLLEVGTGFHPELTGRENIFLNGAILGMTKLEIQRKFDEIVEFSEIEKFLDTPVKRYSSGMYVRLAFAVAAHMEPEVLIVDEVLAVGDAQFQKKCLGKMEDVGKEGRTIIFVSHNMGAVSALCQKCVLLSAGRIIDFGPANAVISRYNDVGNKSATVEITPEMRVKGGEKIQFLSCVIEGEKDKIARNSYMIAENFNVKISMRSNFSGKLSFWLIIFDYSGKAILSSHQRDYQLLDILPGYFEIVYKPVGLVLMPGNYYITAGAFDPSLNFLEWIDKCQSFEILQSFSDGRQFDGRWGIINQKAEWSMVNK